MSQILFAPQVHCTYADLALIVGNASFLWERLDSKCFAINKEQTNELEINRRCNRWCQVVGLGNWNILQKRLQWEGLNLDQVRPYLGTVQLQPNQPLPKWARTLEQIIRTATQFTPEAESFLPTDAQNPVPFEDIFLPVIKVARQQLLTRLSSPQLTQDHLPLSILTESAYRSLEGSLLKQLARLCTKTLRFEFSQVCPFGQNLLNLFGQETQSSQNKTYYTKFVNQLLQDGLFAFFQKYPVLGRLVATAVNFWVESTAEFLQRLERDQVSIQRVFSSKAVNLQKSDRKLTSLGKVAEIQSSLSDPHNEGRSVILLTFASGLKLVYKPKILELEVAFNQFLSWCNQHSQLLDFKVIQVLSRTHYGWVEYVEHQPCTDEAAAERFYQRSGMLLCVLYVLKGTDCHNENVIANGEHLVLIDMETLLHPEANPIEDSLAFQEFDTTATQHLLDSVLRTGLLPSWEFSADRKVAYDMSGLGSTEPQQAPRKVPRWQAINTDNMHLRYEFATMPIEKNVPRLGNTALSANDYQGQITAGFEQMYRFLMSNKDKLLAPDSPLAAMQAQQVRFVFRATQVYFTIQQNSLAPNHLKHGVNYSIELDHLSRAFLVAQEKPNVWSILSAELQAMQQLDIPFFTASTASNELSVEGYSSISHYFERPSYQDVLNQLQALSESNLAQQVAIIQSSFYAKVAQTSSREHEQWNIESLPLLNSEQLIEKARAIAAELETRAMLNFDGSVNWIGLSYVPEADRFQLQVLSDSLYDGRCGIALFLAALSQVTGDRHFHDLALQTLQSLRQQIQTTDLYLQQRIARRTGLGAATGLGSMVYTFVKISQFLKDETLLRDAQALADWITPELITADKQFDIIGGAAGAILGLLSLYRVTGKTTVLEKAIACGQHLLSHQISYEGLPQAWQTFGEKPLTGFSHGAAGISYALLQLYAITQDRVYYDAALEGIEYERRVFSQSNANWPDFRRGQLSFPSQWCHGATGIGIARLGGLSIFATEAIKQDIEVALTRTQMHPNTEVDHLCCGNFGRIELLLVAAQKLDRQELQTTARQKAAWVVARAEQTGGYQLFGNLPNSVFNPCFFQGTAGIGYELLRLAVPEALPSVLLWE
jgi:type 2 lantibiotic biosynthesis protein LanM